MNATFEGRTRSAQVFLRLRALRRRQRLRVPETAPARHYWRKKYGVIRLNPGAGKNAVNVTLFDEAENPNRIKQVEEGAASR